MATSLGTIGISSSSSDGAGGVGVSVINSAISVSNIGPSPVISQFILKPNALCHFLATFFPKGRFPKNKALTFV